MTIAQSLSLLFLFGCLGLAIWRRLNIGVVALGAALLVVALTGVKAAVLYDEFPGNLFVLIAGVSLLFAHMERSGAIQWFVDRIFAAIGERDYLLPWAGFLIAAAFSTAGAFSTAPIALLVPLVAHVSGRYPRSFYLNELAVIIGANCAGLSPLNPTGALVHTVTGKFHVRYDQWGLWAVSVVTAVVVVAVLQLLDAWRRGRGSAYAPRPAVVAERTDGALDEQGRPRNRVYALASGLALVVFVVLVVGFQTDVGLTSMAMVAILQVAFHPKESDLMHRVPWSAILLLCGLLTYLGLMQTIGTMDQVQKGLTHVGSAWLLVLVLAYLTALLCNIESSTLGVLGLMMPIVCSTFGSSPAIFWILAAVAVPAALMVMNPIHVAGTLVMANSIEEDQPGVFQHLLALAVTLALVTPGLLAIYPILRL